MLVLGATACARGRAAHQLAGTARGRAGDGLDLLRAARPGDVGEVLLYVGLALAFVATGLYVRDGRRQLRRTRLHESQAQLDLLVYTRSSGDCAGQSARYARRKSRRRKPAMDDVPRPRLADDTELKDLIQQLTDGGERGLLPAAPAARQDRHPARRAGQPPARKHDGGEDIFSGADVQRLTEILAGASPTRRGGTATLAAERGPAAERGRAARWLCTAPSAASSTPRAPTTASGAARCSRADEAGGDPATATYRIGETGDFMPVDIDEVARARPGARDPRRRRRAGESFAGRGRADDDRPPARLASLPRRHDGLARPRAARPPRQHWYLDDCGSLNGTYVNRERIDSQRLEDGDELQVGKYKLTFHAR